MRLMKEDLLELKKSYYSGCPIVSDEVYDELESIWMSQNIDDSLPVDIGQVVPFSNPYLSLRKINTSQLIEWEKTRDSAYVVTPKVDGVSMELEYEYSDGELHLQRAKTRGGVERTDSVKRGLHPSYIEFPVPESSLLWEGFRLVVRGEMYLPLKLLPQVKQAGFANLRNLVAGMVNSDSPTMFDGQVHFATWNVLDDGFRTYSDGLFFLKCLGFNTVPVVRFESVDFLQLAKEDNAREYRSKFEYELDGCVIWCDNKQAWECDKGKTVYQNAIAWKFPSQYAVSVIRDVVWSVGSAGWITPVVKIDPVEIGGVTVQSVNVFNPDMLQSLDIKINSQVIVQRSNDVIPYIAQKAVDTNESKDIVVPTVCPCCNDPNILKVGPRLLCQNDLCQAKFGGVIGAWAGVHGMKHFRQEAIQFLEPYFSSFDGHPVVAMYSLSDEKIHECFGTAGKAARFIRYFTAAKQKTTAATLMTSLNISGVALKSVQKILEKAGSLSAVHSYLRGLTNRKVVEDGTLTWINNNQAAWQSVVELAKRLGCDAYEAPKTVEWRGRVVITGVVPGVSRKELQDYVQNLGWEFTNSVTKETTYLISQGESGSSKYRSAIANQIPIITWEMFMQMQ